MALGQHVLERIVVRSRKDQQVSVQFTLVDHGGNLITGAVDGDFAKNLFLNGAVDAATVTITETAVAGIYTAAFTPDEYGTWYLSIEHVANDQFVDVEAHVGEEPRAHVHIVDDSGTIHVLAWLQTYDEIVKSGLTSCTVTIRDTGGTSVFSDSDASADAAGVFYISGSLSPTTNRPYTIEVQIVHSVLGTIATTTGFGVVS